MYYFTLCFLWHQTPQWAKASSFSGIHDHTQTHHILQDSSARVISPSPRPLPDNIQHSQETDIHALDGIRTHNPSRGAAADPRLRPFDPWDWLLHSSNQTDMELRNFTVGLSHQVQHSHHAEIPIQNSQSHNKCTLVCNKSYSTYRLQQPLRK